MSLPDVQTAVVTGGAGFIGSHLVEQLVDLGTRVVVIDDQSTGRPENLDAVADAIDIHRLDVVHDDLAEVFRDVAPDVVFHLAGSTDVTGSLDRPRVDLEQNVAGTINVIEGLRAGAAGARLVNVSSAAVYGFAPDAPWREDTLPVPVWPYAINKLAAELYVGAACLIHGLRTANVRLFHVFGPRLCRQIVFDVFRKLRDRSDELHLFGDGTEVLDLSFVANVVDALLLVASRAPLEGETYNVASGREITTGDLAQRICTTLGVDPRIVYTSDARPGTPPAFRANTDRLRGLGYEPRVELDDGLARTAAWFRTAALPE